MKGHEAFYLYLVTVAIFLSYDAIPFVKKYSQLFQVIERQKRFNLEHNFYQLGLREMA